MIIEALYNLINYVIKAYFNGSYLHRFSVSVVGILTWAKIAANS